MNLSTSTSSAIIGSVTGIVAVLLLNAISGQYFAKISHGKRGGETAQNNLTSTTLSKVNSPIRATKKSESEKQLAEIEPMETISMTPILNTIKRHSQSFDESGIPTLVVGIAGGSGSGKTTLADAIFSALGREENVTFISHDSYYKDLSSWTMAQREAQNFDHPNSLDTDLLVEHVKKLRKGESADIPIYDFSTHSRTKNTTTVIPRKVILVEGILIFTEPALSDLLDVKIFVDTESDVRLMRRIQRDCQERGRSIEQVLQQYTKTVRPMHIEFVEPSKRKADIIVPVGINSVALSLITDHLKVALDDLYGGVRYIKTPFDEKNKQERVIGVNSGRSSPINLF